MLTHRPSSRRKTHSARALSFWCHLQAKHRDAVIETLSMPWNTKWPVLSTNKTWLVYVSGGKKKKEQGSYFTILAMQEWFIFQMKTDWRHKHRQAHATWMLLNGLVLAGCCKVGMIHRAAVLMCCAVLWQGSHYATSLGDARLQRSALNSPQNSVKCLLTSC